MLVLGFDAGCGTCSDIATQIKRQVSDKLDVENLGSPKLMEWSQRVFGRETRWTPTLFEVEENDVKAWTGWRMSLALSRRLGPLDTLRVVRVLAQFRGASPVPVKEMDVAEGLSRGQFLKGAGGLTLTAALASSAIFAPSPATAQSATSPLDVVRTTPITGDKLKSLSRRIALNPDMRAISGTTLSTPARIAATKPRGATVKLRNGTIITVITYNSSERRIMSHATYSQRVGRAATSIAKALVKDGNGYVVTKVSEGGRLWRRPANISPSGFSALSASGPRPLGECPPESGGGGAPPCAVYYRDECLKWEDDLRCIAKDGGRTTGYCLGCVAGAAGVVATRGLSKMAWGFAAGGCTGCLDSGSGAFRGCSRCVAGPYRVRRVDYSRC